MKYVYASIDLGSDSVKVAVCELYQNKLNLLSATAVKSRGIKQGLIVDVDLATESVTKALDEIEEMLGIKIKKVIANVSSYNADFSLVHGKVQILEDVVSGDDITNVLESAYKTKEIPEKEMVAIIPIDFEIDNNGKIKDPKGQQGGILAVRAEMISVPKKNIYSVVGLLERIGLEVVDVTIGGIGDMHAFRTKENTNLVGAIVNIGSETTNVSIYNKSIIVRNSILGIGSKNIDNDISFIYKLKNSDTRKIKEKFATSCSKYSSGHEYFDVIDKSGENRKISQKEISELLQPRFEEILVLARKEIKLLTKQPVDYIIITGGTSSMVNFDLLCESVLGDKVTVGNIRIPGVRNNKYSTAIGNIVYFINKLKLKGIEYTMFSDDDMDALSLERKGLINISSEGTLGKVFGYFFNE